MTSLRADLFERYAALTRELRVAAEALDVLEAARVLAARQRVIDETRTLDGVDAPLSPAEARVLEGARADEAFANECFEVERRRFVELFQDVAKTRRAHGGYASIAAPAELAAERTA